MKFSEELWKASAKIINSIHQHPFNRELANGNLEREKFQFYLKQDSLYLIDFARALAITAAKSQCIEDMTSFLQFAQGAIVAERQLHQHYFDLYGITVDVPQAGHALLPCFWIYREVGVLSSAELGATIS